MTFAQIEQAIEYLLEQKKLFPHSYNVLSGHFDTAIAALRKEQERQKGCEYCSNVQEGNETVYREFYKNLGNYPDYIGIAKVKKTGKYLLHIEIDRYDYDADIPSNCCPNCGRELKGDAE